MTKPTLARRGLDVGNEHPKPVSAVCDRAIELVITIGDVAERELPCELPGGPRWIHWNISDPADFDGTPQSAGAFEEAAKAIEQNLPEIRRLVATLTPAASDRVQPCIGKCMTRP
jgi:protein-tyrosine-phosphatase